MILAMNEALINYSDATVLGQWEQGKNAAEVEPGSNLNKFSNSRSNPSNWLPIKHSAL